MNRRSIAFGTCIRHSLSREVEEATKRSAFSSGGNDVIIMCYSDHFNYKSLCSLHWSVFIMRSSRNCVRFYKNTYGIVIVASVNIILGRFFFLRKAFTVSIFSVSEGITQLSFCIAACKALNSVLHVP